MRYISSPHIKPQMIIAKTLYTLKGDPLIMEGRSLNERTVQRIKDFGYNGIYIEDEISKDIKISDVISSKLKAEALHNFKNFYQRIPRNINSYRDLDKLKNVVEDIINELISYKVTMINIVDIKTLEDYYYYHAVNTAIISLIIGLDLKLNRIQLFELGLAALLHDVGKAFIDNNILTKTAQLTEKEEEILQNHAYLGYKYLKDLNCLSTKTYIGVLEHHEKYNGTGYPNKKKDANIYIYGRIIAIASCYDAMTSEKPYNPAKNPSEAMEYIMGASGTLFDPELVQIFAKKVAPYPTGTLVNLSDNRTGIVINNYKDCCIRPVIKIIKSQDQHVTPYYIDLKNDSSSMKVTIQSIVA